MDRAELLQKHFYKIIRVFRFSLEMTSVSWSSRLKDYPDVDLAKEMRVAGVSRYTGKGIDYDAMNKESLKVEIFRFLDYIGGLLMVSRKS